MTIVCNIIELIFNLFTVSIQSPQARHFDIYSHGLHRKKKKKLVWLGRATLRARSNSVASISISVRSFNRSGQIAGEIIKLRVSHFLSPPPQFSSPTDFLNFIFKSDDRCISVEVVLF